MQQNNVIFRTSDSLGSLKHAILCIVTQPVKGDKHMADTQVTVYSTTWCGFCKAAKQYFSSKNVAFTEVDVEQDMAAAQQIVQETGQMGVPVIRIGSHVIVGFDRPKIDAALKDLQLA